MIKGFLDTDIQSESITPQITYSNGKRPSSHQMITGHTDEIRRRHSITVKLILVENIQHESNQKTRTYALSKQPKPVNFSS